MSGRGTERKSNGKNIGKKVSFLYPKKERKTRKRVMVIGKIYNPLFLHFEVSFCEILICFSFFYCWIWYMAK